MSVFTYEALGNALRSGVESVIDANYPQSLGVSWDNVNHENAPNGDKTDKWVGVAILDGQSVQADMGSNRRWRRPGVLKIAIHTELDRGDRTARQIADAFVRGLRGATLTGDGGTVTLRSPRVTTLGRAGQWWRVDVDFSFWSDDFDR